MHETLPITTAHLWESAIILLSLVAYFPENFNFSVWNRMMIKIGHISIYTVTLNILWFHITQAGPMLELMTFQCTWIGLNYKYNIAFLVSANYFHWKLSDVLQA